MAAQDYSNPAPTQSDAGGGGGGVRLAMQGRLDALNTLFASSSIGGGILGVDAGLVPIVTAGARLVDGKLFVGLGFGFFGTSTTNDMGGTEIETTQSWLSFCPLASFDLIANDSGALSLLGWFTFASAGNSESCAGGMCMESSDGATAIGLNLGVGIRGKIGDGLAIGTEWGWGFASVDQEDLPASMSDESTFFHGIFGNILFEGSVPL